MSKYATGFAVGAAILLLGCGGSARLPEEKMLTGWVTRGEILSPEYPRFSAVYDTVRVSGDVVELLREVNSGVECLVLFGTWCSDSWREVPRFLKTVDLAGIDQSTIKFYAVDRSKKSADGTPDRHGLERVPTFIFFRDGKEVGRIVEKPATMIEDEMLLLYAGEGK